MYKQFLLLISLLPFVLFSQEENIKGIGMITPEILVSDEAYPSGEETQVIKLNLYNHQYTPSGDYLIKEKNDHQIVETYLVSSQGTRNPIQHETSALVWTGYKSHAMQYFKIQNGFLEVRLNGKNYWLNQEESTQLGFKAVSWKTYYENCKSTTITANYNMNLRSKPDKDSKKIMLLKINRYNTDFYHLMSMTGNFQGNWAEVEVSIWNNTDGYCKNPDNPTKKVTGWIKYLDDTGFPNLFDVPTPCC
ncbi:MAG: hypothetical protein DHS20C18_27140 [Saprospiraceae bacterium]|nr:MAG: hypothetical protein DHS20C18_27140 [Saprospiraceae bacterium]